MDRQRLFAIHRPGADTAPLHQLSLQLLTQQQQTWQQLIEGYAAIPGFRFREIQCDGYTVRLQFNPRRIVSSGAKVDPKSISERRCFLCPENLPEAQRGILCCNEFLILCNPAPIFAEHFAISNVRHLPQSIEGFLGVFLELARELSPRYTVFYNGPRCGASAPDHMHFQASPSGVIPIENDAVLPERRQRVGTLGEVEVLRLTGMGRSAVVMEGRGAGSVENAVRRFIDAMRGVMGVPEEPMVNILCSYRHPLWRIIVFPRRKHRPDVYFLEDEGRVLISPAAVDLGGLVITPLEKDFERVDAGVIDAVFREVSATEESVGSMITAMNVSHRSAARQ